MFLIQQFHEKYVCDPAVSDASDYDILFPDITRRPPGDAEYCIALFEKIQSLSCDRYLPFFLYQLSKAREPRQWLKSCQSLFAENISTFSMERILELQNSLADCEVHLDHVSAQVRNQLMKTAPDTSLSVANSLEKYDSGTAEVSDIVKNKKSAQHNIDRKFPVTGNLNILIDAFYQLVFEKKTCGQPYLDITLPELVTFITSTFVDRNNKPLSVATVRTMLSPNKIDKRPKIGIRVNLEKNHAS